MNSSPRQSPVFQTKAVLLVATAHFVHDTYTGFVAPLLPRLIDKLELPLTLAGTLVLLLRLPALAQPLFGHLADRRGSKLFVVLAPAITATLMSLIGLADSFGALAALLLVVGFSTASFHAPAPAMISRVAGDRVGRGMSLFMVGGELGRAVGPIVAVSAASWWGLGGLWRVMVLGLGASALLAVRFKRMSYGTVRKDPLPLLRAARQVGPTVASLGGLVLARSLVVGATAAYLPTLLTTRGVSFVVAGAALTVFELAGVVGALLGGSVSDRLGRRRVLGALRIAAPLLLLAVLHSGGVLLAAMLVLLGFVGLAIQPIMLAIVQDRSPASRGAANGLYLAMSFLGQAAAVLAVGAMGDAFGLQRALHIAAFTSLALLPFLWFVPGRETSPAATAPSAAKHRSQP